MAEYSPREAGLPGWVHNCGPHMNPNLPWWPLAHALFDYVGRCCFLLQSGRNVAQVAVYHNFRTCADSLWREPADEPWKWPKSSRSTTWATSWSRSRCRCATAGSCSARGLRTRFCASIPRRGPPCPWPRCVKIRDLIRQGATVVWTAEPPAAAPGLTNYPQCDVEFQAILADLKDRDQLQVLASRDYANLIPIVENCRRPPAWRVDGDSPLRFVHRRTADADLFFVVNTADQVRRCAGHLPRQGSEARVVDPRNRRDRAGRQRDDRRRRAVDGVHAGLRLPLRGLPTGRRPRRASPARRPKRQPPAPIDVNGPWEVAFPDGWAAPAKTIFASLQSWTCVGGPGHPLFQRHGHVPHDLCLPRADRSSQRRASLDLGRVAEVCDVRLNGKLVGVAFHPPYRFDVTRHLVAGDNRLEIRVANLWNNRLVGDAGLPKAQRVSRMAPEDFYEKFRGKPLMDSGLLGPVRIRFGQNVDIE